MTRDEAFLILDLAEWHAGNWPGLHGYGGESAARIPQESRPTVLQGSREQAEAEVLRLAGRNPRGCYVLFTATHIATPVTFATHVNLHGVPMQTRSTHRLAQIDDIPF